MTSAVLELIWGIIHAYLNLIYAFNCCLTVSVGSSASTPEYLLSLIVFFISFILYHVFLIVGQYDIALDPFSIHTHIRY